MSKTQRRLLPNTHTAAGRVSAYGFACGLQETHSGRHSDRVRLYAEHGVYVVQGMDDGVSFRHVFDTLADARRNYRWYCSYLIPGTIYIH